MLFQNSQSNLHQSFQDLKLPGLSKHQTSFKFTSELKVHSSSHSVCYVQPVSGIKKSVMNLPCSDLFEESDEESIFNQPKVPLNSAVKDTLSVESEEQVPPEVLLAYSHMCSWDWPHLETPLQTLLLLFYRQEYEQHPQACLQAITQILEVLTFWRVHPKPADSD